METASRFRPRPLSRLLVALGLVLASIALPATLGLGERAEAHLATWGSWDITQKNLTVLFPRATTWLRKKHAFSESEVETIEKALGFSLYPEDRNPEFYIAIDDSGGKKKLLGVAIFIDPRVEARVEGGEVIRLEVGVGVDKAGRVARVALYDYKGNPAMAEAAFLSQLQGRDLRNSFVVAAAGGPDGAGRAKIKPVSGEKQESQLVANAAFEALYLMKIALGR